MTPRLRVQWLLAASLLLCVWTCSAGSDSSLQPLTSSYLPSHHEPSHDKEYNHHDHHPLDLDDGLLNDAEPAIVTDDSYTDFENEDEVDNDDDGMTAFVALDSSADPTPLLKNDTAKPSNGTADNSTASRNATIEELKKHHEQQMKLEKEKRAKAAADRLYFGNVKVARMMECTVVVADALFAANMSIKGKLKVNGVLATQKLRAMNTRSRKIMTRSIMSPTGVVLVNGDLAIVNRPRERRHNDEDDDEDFDDDFFRDPQRREAEEEEEDDDDEDDVHHRRYHHRSHHDDDDDDDDDRRNPDKDAKDAKEKPKDDKDKDKEKEKEKERAKAAATDKKPSAAPTATPSASARNAALPNANLRRAIASSLGSAGSRAKKRAASAKGSASKSATAIRPSRKRRSGSLKAVSFLAEDVVISGVKQWKLVRHEDFEDKDSVVGWSLPALSSCGGVDHFLGGPCNIAGGRITKTFTNLPPHSQVRLTARYHMIDNWQGETGYAQLGSDVVWTEQSRRSRAGEIAGGLDVCGSELFPERRMSIPIDVTLPHTDSTIQVSFGSTAFTADEDACQRSFGVDDVMLYLR